MPFTPPSPWVYPSLPPRVVPTPNYNAPPWAFPNPPAPAPAPIQMPAMPASLVAAKAAACQLLTTGTMPVDPFEDTLVGGDGVNTCKICSYKLTDLFLTKACDRCDGLLKPDPEEVPEEQCDGYVCTELGSSWLHTQVPASGFYFFRTREDALSHIAATKQQQGATVLLALRGGTPGLVPWSRKLSIDVIWNEEQRTSTVEALIISAETI